MLANEIPDSGIGSRQRLLVGQENDAEVLGAGLLAEAGAVDDRDVLWRINSNSARSIMAEAIVNYKGRPNFTAYRHQMNVESAAMNGSMPVEKASWQGIECRHGGSEHDQHV